MNLFYIINEFENDFINESEFKNYIRKNILKMWDIQDEKSVYSYASLKSIKCLKIIHETFLETFNNDQQLINPYYKVHPWELCGKTCKRPIHYVAESNLSKQLLYLINIVNVNVDSMDIYGNTALHIICNYNYINLINILLYAGHPDIDIMNIFSETPLLICLKNENVELISILLKLNPILIYVINGTTFNLTEYNLNPQIEHLFQKFNRRQRNILRQKKYKMTKASIIKDFVRKYYYNSKLPFNDLYFYRIINIAENIGLHINITNPTLSNDNYDFMDDDLNDFYFNKYDDLYKQITKSLITHTLKNKIK